VLPSKKIALKYLIKAPSILIDVITKFDRKEFFHLFFTTPIISLYIVNTIRLFRDELKQAQYID